MISGINAFATVIWEDFVSALPTFQNLEDQKQMRLIKVIGIFVATIMMLLAFLVSLLTGIVEAAMLITSATSGQLIGIFLLALLVPAANWKGTTIGFCISLIISIWLTIGHLAIGAPQNFYPTSVEGCDNSTSHSFLNQTVPTSNYDDVT